MLLNGACVFCGAGRGGGGLLRRGRELHIILAVLQASRVFSYRERYAAAEAVGGDAVNPLLVIVLTSGTTIDLLDLACSIPPIY